MKLALAERFVRDARALQASERGEVFEVILALPAALGSPHLHAGLGLRKLHARGIYEVRVGLKLRIVFGLERDVLTLVRVATHEEVRRYLKSL